MKEIRTRFAKKPKWMEWDRVMIYIAEDGKVKMAKDVPGVMERLMPEPVFVRSGLLDETTYSLMRAKGKGKKNKLATAIAGKNVSGAALIVKEEEDVFGERTFCGMTAEEAGKWVGRIVKVRGHLK